MRVGYTAKADNAPQQFRVNHLQRNVYEIYMTENVTESQARKHKRVLPEEENRKEYSYTEYTATVDIENYESAVEALIALKYTTGDEIALSRKDHASAEYIAYIAYVEACKAFARGLFKS